MEVIALPVVDGHPVAVYLGHAVGGTGVERGALGLGHFLNLAEHLAGGRLVEADLGIHESDGVEDAGHAQSSDLAGEDRLGEAGLHEGLCREVVNLGGAVLLEDVDHRDLVEEVTGYEGDPVLEVGDSLEVDGGRPANHADHLVALREQKLGEVGTVLAGDAGDERALGHGELSTYNLLRCLPTGLTRQRISRRTPGLGG